MKEKIKKDINVFLENTIELDFNLLKNNVDKILLKYYKNKDIYDYKTVCDNTNNLYNSQHFIRIDVYLEEIKSQFVVINITINTDELLTTLKM